MALRNGKLDKDKNTKSVALPEGVIDLCQAEMGNQDSKKTIKFSGWSQTASDVMIILHSGRKLSDNDVAVDFFDNCVKVGLTDGRKWSCCFNQPVDKNSCRVQVKKLKIHLIAKKKVPNVTWETYEKVADAVLLPPNDATSVESSPSKKSVAKSKSDHEFKKFQTVQSSAEKISPKVVNPSKVDEATDHEFPRCHGDLAASGDSATMPVNPNDAMDQEFDDTTNKKRPCAAGKEITDYANDNRESASSSTAMIVGDRMAAAPGAGVLSDDIFILQDPSSSTESTAAVAEPMDIEEIETVFSSSSVPLLSGMSGDDIFNELIGHGESLGKVSEIESIVNLADERELETCMVDSTFDAKINDVSLLSQNVPIASESADDEHTAAPSGDVRELETLKTSMYETHHLDGVVLTIYVRQINRATLRVNFTAADVEVVFQTSDQTFLRLHSGATSSTLFQWKANLVAAIVPEKCFSKLQLANLEVNLKKKVAAKWGMLTPIKPMATSSAVPASQNTWIPTQSGPAPSSSSSTATNVAADDLKTENKTPTSALFDEASDQPSSSSRQSTSSYFSRDIFGSEKRDNSSLNKPTCMVSPITSRYDDNNFSSSSSMPVAVARPGLVGLENIGNTCFMNSVLQVLANTAELKDYFLDGSYQKELNETNPLGMGGKLANAFGYLMKILWTSNQCSFEPSKLKSLVAAKQARFVGYSQHDAEEFMEFLLDGLHEDLNRVHNKPYFADKDIAGDSDEIVANEAWRRHKMRNDSHIIDVFQGQYRSRVVCPTCQSVSITFDPFSIIQVPIPKKKKLVNVIFMSTVPSNKPVKYQILIGIDATVDHLKDAIYQRTQVLPQNLRILEVLESKIVSCFTKGSSLSKITPSDVLVACAVLSEKDVGESVREFMIVQRTLMPKAMLRCCSYCHRENNKDGPLKRCTRCYRTSYCNQECQRKDWTKHKLLCHLDGEPVGCPFVISIPQSKLDYRSLCNAVEGYARYSVNYFRPPPIARQTMNSRKVSSASTSSLSSIGSSSSEHIEDAEAMSARSEGEASESASEVPESSCSYDVNDNREDSVGGQSTDPSQPPTRIVLGTQQNASPLPPPPFFLRPCTLQGIVIHGTERLQNNENSILDLSGVRSLLVEWKNKENCDTYVEVATKDLEYDESMSSNFRVGSSYDRNNSNVITLADCLTLFTEPEILHPDQAWLCPKCKVHCQATKEMSLWRLPPTLIIHLKRFSFSSMFWRNKIDDLVEFPLRDLDMSPYLKRELAPDEPPPVYDLYGVINHMGDLLGGHYTSYARCPDLEDCQRNQVGWRLFDDSVVKPCLESQVISRSAYVLFYRRRGSGMPIFERIPMDVTPVVADNLDNVRAEDDDRSDFDDSQDDALRISEVSTTTHMDETDIDSVD